ncbi:MAG: hypothetical protein FJW63_08325, partial [Actinobacteria bacterium]|nr:hypothetical protein [Actinomycetota bacterium]
MDIYDQCAVELKDLSEKEEDILSYCFFPENTRKFLEDRKHPEKIEKLPEEIKITETKKRSTEETGKKTPLDIEEKEKKFGARLSDLDIKKLKE